MHAMYVCMYVCVYQPAVDMPEEEGSQIQISLGKSSVQVCTKWSVRNVMERTRDVLSAITLLKHIGNYMHDMFYL